MSSSAKHGFPVTVHVHRSWVVPFRTEVRTWFAISLQTFGGPAGQTSAMPRALVDEKAEDRPAPIPARPQLLHDAPGPEAQ